VVIDLNATKIKRSVFSTKIGDALSAEMTRKQSLQPERNYVGASSIGGECERAIQFQYAGAPRERTFDPKTLRKFAFGHLTEEWCRFEFKDAGFDLVQRDPRTLKPYTFAQLENRFAGTPDGVFLGGPIDIGWPRLWEHKGTGSKSYRSIERDGLKKSKPTYYGQTNTYMAYLGLTKHPAIFTVSNLDTGEQMHLEIEFDAENAQAMTDRAGRIVHSTAAAELLPRPFAASDHFVCKSMCDFPTRCWKLPS
jgi:hypothetical protein